ncbi:TrmH family RNA methyltransferase [Amphibiibacter pelophylacis]|uniref:TrmH family RNA methyltransferase n=1 Tax=Amphibiibacter pelophylacis TaxID=1799477 RepID=UPI003BFA677C
MCPSLTVGSTRTPTLAMASPFSWPVLVPSALCAAAPVNLGVRPPKRGDKSDYTKEPVRQRADAIKPYKCKYLIAVIENPMDIRNIGTVIRNVNALGVEKVYVVDSRMSLPDDWQEIRKRKSLSETSVSAVKWSFVKRFDSTEQCLAHLERYRYTSIVTSPHVKGKNNYILHEADYTCPRLAGLAMNLGA